MHKIVAIVLAVSFAASLCATESAQAKPPLIFSADGVPYAKVYGDFDKPPQERVLAVPYYPKKLQSQKIVGAAVVRYRVDTKGRTRDAVIISATREEFGAAAKEASTRSRYLAAQKDGKPVECEIELLYHFGQPSAFP
jgi:TonB family protein